jgi:hypothetical protein
MQEEPMMGAPWKPRFVTARVVSLTLVLAALFAVCPPVSGQETPPEPEDQPSRLAIHGFLSQAYARSDGHQVLGITHGGTTDYRQAAIQIRYAITGEDVLVFQLNHERIGPSPIGSLESDVEFDWGFFEHRWGPNLIRVGKVPLPVGIFNEIRDVGTLLPFYRPPGSIYGEGSFTSETVEGGIFTRSFQWPGWNLDADVFYGGWDNTQSLGVMATARIENAIGLQAWLGTPVPGLRFGLGAQHFTNRGGAVVAADRKVAWRRVNLSAEWATDRIIARTELQDNRFEANSYLGYYGQLILRWTPHFDVNFQADFSRLGDRALLGRASINLDQDLAVGLKYSFSANFAVKGELHSDRGFLTEVPMPNFLGKPLRTKIGILSLSASF